MAGLINSAMPGAAPAGPVPNPLAPPDQAAPQGKPNTLKITPEVVMQGLHLNPQQTVQVNKIVMAGQKVMFSPQTHNMMVKQMQGPGPMAQKLAQGVGGLMGLLQRESQGSLPPKLLIPVGMLLLAHAAAFIAQTEGITDQDVGEAMHLLVALLLKQGGVDPDKVVDAAQKHAQGAQPPAGGAPPDAPPAPDAAPPSGAVPPQQGAM
jgi:hypothetical protein